MKQYALIVAGGTGTRMGTAYPKQFLLLSGKPVLMHTIEQFHSFGCELVIVLPEAQFAVWNELCAQHTFTIPHQMVAGGDSRFHSVQKGLEYIPEGVLVAIHDGVRPCISKEVVHRSFQMAAMRGNAIAVVHPKDSLRIVNDSDDNHSVNRDYYRQIQTPQTFQSNLIKDAYAQARHSNFTDDAGVLEASGHAIHLFEGDYRNIKITTPEDLQIAEVFLFNQKGSN